MRRLLLMYLDSSVSRHDSASSFMIRLPAAMQVLQTSRCSG